MPSSIAFRAASDKKPRFVPALPVTDGELLGPAAGVNELAESCLSPPLSFVELFVGVDVEIDFVMALDAPGDVGTLAKYEVIALAV